jgi:hypothetical protein
LCFSLKNQKNINVPISLHLLFKFPISNLTFQIKEDKTLCFSLKKSKKHKRSDKPALTFQISNFQFPI